MSRGQDLQAQGPLGWCRYCGTELYDPGLVYEGCCEACREDRP